MKLGDVTEVGFYKEVCGEDIWECFENTDSDEEFRKAEPLLLSRWYYDYVDENDRKVYRCHGLLHCIGRDYPDLDVEKVDQEYEVSGSMGHKLIEKKPTYKQRFEALYNDLLEVIQPYLGDFTGYDEKEQAFNIVQAVKELLEDRE